MTSFLLWEETHAERKAIGAEQRTKHPHSAQPPPRDWLAACLLDKGHHLVDKTLLKEQRPEARGDSDILCKKRQGWAGGSVKCLPFK